jgi:hypothetical protein
LEVKAMNKTTSTKQLSGVTVANEGHKRKKIHEFVPKAKAKMTTSMTLATFMKVENLNN